jgi:hypothetical protein
MTPYFPDFLRLHLESTTTHLPGRCRRAASLFLQERLLILFVATPFPPKPITDLTIPSILPRRDIAELSGSTARVYSLISSLHALNTNLYPINERPPNLLPDEPFYDLSRASGRVFEGPRIDKIELLSVPIVVPACGSAGAERGGEELIKELTLTVESGNHTFISGRESKLPSPSRPLPLILLLLEHVSLMPSVAHPSQPMGPGRALSLESSPSSGPSGAGRSTDLPRDRSSSFLNGASCFFI